jgi:hypothetical protein
MSQAPRPSTSSGVCERCGTADAPVSAPNDEQLCCDCYLLGRDEQSERERDWHGTGPVVSIRPLPGPIPPPLSQLGKLDR